MRRLILLLSAWLCMPGMAQETGAGTALSFNGRNTAVSIPHTESLNPYPFSVTAWVKTSQSEGSAGMINKYLSGAFCGWQVYLLDGHLRAWYFGDATHYVWDGSDGMDGGPVADGRWHHLAFSVGEDGGRLYVDGVLSDALGWSGRPTRTTAQQGLTLGAYPGTAPNFFRGQMDEVTVWEARLSTSEIRQRMRRSLRGDEPGLVAYYRCDEGAGDVTADAAPNAGSQPGLLVGNPGWVPSGAPLVPEGPTNGLPAIVRLAGAPELEAGAPLVLEGVGGPADGLCQWMLDGADISGATNRTLSRPAVGVGDEGAYRVVIRSGADVRVSPPAWLRLIGAPAWLSPLVGAVNDAGATFSLAARVTGGRPLTYTWLMNGHPLSTPNANVLALGPLLFAEAGDYQLVASNSFGSITSAVATLKVVALPLTNALVLHLPFDGDFRDQSGRENHARYAVNGPNARPAPTFGAGQIGRAFQYTTRQDGSAFEYATLGYPADLRLGEQDDFSVSLWVNYLTHDGDLPFLSNKDWDKSHNPGWAVSTQRSGTARVNLTGPREGTDFFSTTGTPILRTGRWRHLVVSVQRPRTNEASGVSVYVDGKLVNQTATVIQGSLDTAELPFVYASPRVSRQSEWAVNIGQDGTGVYFDKGGTFATAARVDDLGMWRRALTALEVQAIYEAGLEGLDLSQAVVSSQIAIREAAGQVTLVWPGNPRVRLERGGALDSPDWTDVSLMESTNSVTIPSGDASAFFRLLGVP